MLRHYKLARSLHLSTSPNKKTLIQGQPMGHQRKRIAYALLISTALLSINVIAVVTGYAEGFYRHVGFESREKYKQISHCTGKGTAEQTSPHAHQLAINELGRYKNCR